MSDDAASQPKGGRLDRIAAGFKAWWRSGFEVETPETRADRRSRHDPKRGRKIMIAVAAVPVALVVLLVLFDWNWLRGPIGQIASARLNRTVAIVGDLDVHPWSWTPTVEAYDLRIGQPAWAKDEGAGESSNRGQMATVGRLALRLQLRDLLAGRTVLGLIQVDRADVRLIRAADGRGNWEFGTRKGSSAKLPAIRRLIIDEAKVRLDDKQRKAVFEGVVSTQESTTGESAGKFLLIGDGRLNRAKFTARIEGQPLLDISPSRPYRFNARVSAGATRISADGQIDRPFDLNRFGARFSLSGSDLNDLYVLTGLALPNTGPYQVSGGLVRDYGRWHLNRMNGRVGDSDIGGQITVETAREKPLLLADLRSRRLDFDDLASVFGMAPATGAGETASADQKAMAAQSRAKGRFLSDATLQVDRIRSMDAEVRYRAEAVNAPGLPLRRVDLTVDLKDGVLTGDPVGFSLDRGDIRGVFKLDASRDVPKTDVDLRMTGGRLENWIPARVQGLPVIQGGLVARLKISGTGNSVYKTASSANGTMTLVSNGGEVRQAFAELLGVNVSKGLIMLLSEDPKKTPLRCAVADFQVRNGVARANRIIADTGVVLVEGSGTINFRQETINLRIEGDSKKPRLLRVFVPITVSGPLVSPKLGVETGQVLAQGGAALGLSALSPFAAILAFVDPGLAEDANCTGLLREGRRKGAPAVAPTTSLTADAKAAKKEEKKNEERREDRDRDRERRASRDRD